MTIITGLGKVILFTAVILFLSFVVGFANVPWWIWAAIFVFGIYFLSKGRS